MKDRVSQLGTPKTVREVQQTMGLMGYVRNLIPRFSQMAKPIYMAIKGGHLNWTEKAEEALQEIKAAILNSGQLEGRNDGKNLEADLEIDNIGYQLIVRNEKSNIPTRIMSGSWENPETKFTPVEKQLAALSKRYSELKGLARGQKIIINTNTAGLAHLSKNKVKDARAQNIRWQRWENMLMDPDLIQMIRYKELRKCQKDTGSVQKYSCFH